MQHHGRQLGGQRRRKGRIHAFGTTVALQAGIHGGERLFPAPHLARKVGLALVCELGGIRTLQGRKHLGRGESTGRDLLIADTRVPAIEYRIVAFSGHEAHHDQRRNLRRRAGVGPEDNGHHDPRGTSQPLEHLRLAQHIAIAHRFEPRGRHLNHHLAGLSPLALCRIGKAR